MKETTYLLMLEWSRGVLRQALYSNNHSSLLEALHTCAQSGFTIGQTHKRIKLLQTVLVLVLTSKDRSTVR